MTTTHAAIADTFTTRDVDTIRRAIPTMPDTDLIDLADRARRVAANYDGIPTPTAAAFARNARIVADAVATELATRNPAPASDPVRTVDGAVRFGAALASLGFGDVVTMRSGVMIADHPNGVRAVTDPATGDVTVYGADNPGDRFAWEARFTGATPVDIIAAAVAVAVGRMTI